MTDDIFMRTARASMRRCIEACTDMPSWSSHELPKTSSHRWKSQVRDLLEAVSGGDLASMLNEFTTLDMSRDGPHGLALQCMAEPYNNMTGTARRPLLIALKDSRAVSLPELQRLGYRIKEEHYQRCDKSVFNDDKTGGRPSTKAHLVPDIDHLLHSNSQPVNRDILPSDKKRARSLPARRLDSTYRELYGRFDRKSEISYRSFVRYCNPDFLAYTRATDCCDFCIEGRQAAKTLEQLRNRYAEPDLSVGALQVKYSDRPVHPIYVATTTMIECEEHRNQKRIQRTVYNRHTTALEPNEVTVELDWRKKGHLPLQTAQTCGAFYNDTQYALLGVAIYWCDENGDTQHHAVDVLSQSITEDSHCTLEGLRTAFRLLQGSQTVPCNLMGAKKLHFWTDTGPHFRSYEFLHYCLVEFPAFLGTDCEIDLNFLTEKHGKNQRDTHFNTVRAYTCRAARESSVVISTVSQLITALIKAHANVQTFNRQAKLPIQSCEFYLLNLRASGTYQCKSLKIADLQTVCAMRFHGDEL